MLRISFLSIFILVLLMPFLVMGQKTSAPKEGCEMWRKAVCRRVDIPKQNSGYLIFFKTLLKTVESGDLRAYGFDWGRDDPALTRKEQKELVSAATDSTFMYDHYEPRQEQFKFITSYEVREDWTYDLSSGLTTIEITGVAPLLDVYGDKGDYRGSLALFWLKWKDILPLFEIYKDQSIVSLESLIWDDYFKDSLIARESIQKVENNDANLKMGTAIRTLVLSTEDKTGDRTKNLPERWGDTILGELLCAASLAGSISAYPASSFDPSEKLSHRQLKTITAPKVEETVYKDSLGDEWRKVRSTDFNYYAITKYSVKEEWKFDVATGKTEIKFRTIGLCQQQYMDDGTYLGNKLLFWCSYDEIADILRKYREYHHENNIEWQLWNSRFLEPSHQRKR